MDNNFRIFMNGRNQWGKVPSSFNTNSVAFDTWENNTNTALSFMYSTGVEGEGFLRTNNFCMSKPLTRTIFVCTAVIQEMMWLWKTNFLMGGGWRKI